MRVLITGNSLSRPHVMIRAFVCNTGCGIALGLHIYSQQKGPIIGILCVLCFLACHRLTLHFPGALGMVPLILGGAFVFDSLIQYMPFVYSLDLKYRVLPSFSTSYRYYL